MKKVYGDSRLGYNENAIFDLDEGYDPCEHFDSGMDDFNDIEEVYE
jgi:penicillin-binding protein 1A